MNALTLRRPALVAAATVAAAGLSAWAALTDPFTAGADTVTAIAIALGAAAAVAGWRTMTAPVLATEGRALWPWAALIGLVVAWELVSFFLGPRVDHPTISSLYDAATHGARAVKGLLFFAWMCLGSFLVRR
ncbi:MAG TPA: hypothetical protein VKX24_11900 [Acidimicrobiia bacterium]|nr:hypothetical protein [Acidimicrobiia bacterium]